MAFHRVLLQLAFGDQMGKSIGQCHACTSNRSGTRTAIGLNHITINGDHDFAHRFQIHHST
ncbi:Uncharacterised protein [Vibrio cholerae]|nr:Uncharacterised protein [Vibrio cholerae]CSE00228.1 Uncharacterised protein [Vibrio cholerae]